jgi:hypothetical protein
MFTCLSFPYLSLIPPVPSLECCVRCSKNQAKHLGLVEQRSKQQAPMVGGRIERLVMTRLVFFVVVGSVFSGDAAEFRHCFVSLIAKKVLSAAPPPLPLLIQEGGQRCFVAFSLSCASLITKAH